MNLAIRLHCTCVCFTYVGTRHGFTNTARSFIVRPFISPETPPDPWVGTCPRFLPRAFPPRPRWLRHHPPWTRVSGLAVQVYKVPYVERRLSRYTLWLRFHHALLCLRKFTIITSWQRNAFHITAPLWGESTDLLKRCSSPNADLSCVLCC